MTPLSGFAVRGRKSFYHASASLRVKVAPTTSRVIVGSIPFKAPYKECMLMHYCEVLCELVHQKKVQPGCLFQRLNFRLCHIQKNLDIY